MALFLVKYLGDDKDAEMEKGFNGDPHQVTADSPEDAIRAWQEQDSDQWLGQYPNERYEVREFVLGDPQVFVVRAAVIEPLGGD